MANPLLRKLRPRYTSLLRDYEHFQFPLVDVIIATMRPNLKEELVKKLNEQTVRIGRVVIAAEQYTVEDKLYIVNNLTNGSVTFIEFHPESVSLGQRYNLAVEKTTARHIAIIDDTDAYYPNYLRGQLATMFAEKTKVVGKANPICHRIDIDKRGFLADTYLHGKNRRSVSSALVFTCDAFNEVGGFGDIPSGYDALFLQMLRNRRIHFSDSLPFDFAVVRDVDSENTWNANHLSFRDVMANSTSEEDVKVLLEEVSNG